MSQLADALRKKFGGMVWDTSGDASQEGQPMPGVQKAPDVSGLQWFGGTNGWPELFQQPTAMPFQPQGLLDMVGGPQPDAQPQGLLGMLGRASPPSLMQPGMMDRISGVSASEAPVPRPRPTKPTTYRIKDGDTLSEIAAAFGVSVKYLQKKNNIKNPDRIKAGATLKL
jgi:LysM repeat protein